MLEPVAPMLAVPGPVQDSEGWAFEWKYDGVRCQAAVAGGEVRLYSRRRRDVTTTYPELSVLGDDRRTLLLDGEVVALDAEGRPDFGRLQQRMNLSTPTPARLAAVPVVFFAFDLLRAGSVNCMALPYEDRRERLLTLGIDRPEVRVRRHFRATEVEGAELLRAAREVGLEGLVSKRLDSPYQPGSRSPHWVKTPLTRTQEVVIAGWTTGEGRRSSTFGALLVGLHGNNGLQFAGHVGTGFTDRMLDDVLTRLRPLARRTSPFDGPVPREYARNAHWVEPELVAEVEFRQWTSDRRLRAPSWRGLRPDRTPEEATLG
jgi:bifunctional non-homologous end joining protein LigD